jgi:hypothetical protein
MSDPRKVFVGEIGKRIKVKVGIPLNGLSQVSIFVEKPDGSAAVEWVAGKLGDASDGWIYYDTLAGDLNTAGVYRLYAKAVFVDGREFFGERTTFNVYTPSEG